MQRTAAIISGLIFSAVPHLFSQLPAPSAVSAVGAVTKINTPAKILTLKTDAGSEINVAALATVSVRRVAPGETNLNSATPIALSDITVGDRVLARGQSAGPNMTANLIVVMSQGDIAKKQAADRADWDKRGVTGVVASVAPESVIISAPTPTGRVPVIITLAPNAAVRRYAPDSIRFADAKPGKLADIRPGDQLRARGERTADNTKLIAEEVVTGTFKTIAAVIVAVNAEAGELNVTDLESKTPLTIRVNADSSLRKLPPQAQRAQPLLGRATPLSLADLKPNDAIIVSSTVGSAPGRITAITLLAGVEPILTKPGTQEMSLGSWSLDMGGGIGGP